MAYASLLSEKQMKIVVLLLGLFIVSLILPFAYGGDKGDRATHQSDHVEDVETLPMVHVHGLKLNKDQQRGPVPKNTPWPVIPSSLEGQELDDWMKARVLVSKEAKVTVVVLEPAKHRQLTVAGLKALQAWMFDPQMDGDDPVDGELTIRIHFRTQ